MAVALIGLGSNVGDRSARLEQALDQLGRAAGVERVVSSRPRATRPVGGPAEQAEYLNAAARLVTSLPPEQLFALLRRIEHSAGRTRGARWGPRTLDLDLLLYDRLVLRRPELEIPHPRMAFRRFVLAPAAEVAAEMRHPRIGWTVRQLLDHLDSAARYVAIAAAGREQSEGATGSSGQRGERADPPDTRQAPDPPRPLPATRLARRLHDRFPGPLILRGPDEPLAEASGRDRAGHFLADAIEYLESLAALFVGVREGSAPRGGEADMRPLAVSDFWFAQWRARAELWFRGDTLRRFQDAWQRCAAAVPRPKLLIVVGPAARRWRKGANGGRNVSAESESLWTASGPLCRYVRHSPPGPVLDLATPRWEEAVREAVAAIEAME